MLDLSERESRVLKFLSRFEPERFIEQAKLSRLIKRGIRSLRFRSPQPGERTGVLHFDDDREKKKCLFAAAW
jgi:hypothetical protein